MKKFFVKIKDWFVRHKPSKRRLIQVYAALLYNANIKGFVTGRIYTGGSKVACVPGFNCYSCPGAIGACPLGALQNALASSGTRWPAYVFGIIILFGLILGRTICGFLCPMGLFQDLLYKIKSPKLKKSRVTRVLSYFKYVLLVVLVVIIPLAYSVVDFPVPAFCKYICPVGTLGGALGLLVHPDNADLFAMLGPLFTWKFALAVAIVVGSIFIYRMFCRFLCPLGALYGFFCRVAMLGVKLDKTKCVDCGLCVQICKMDVRRVGDHECIHCGNCIKVCPTKAISWKGSEIFLPANELNVPASAEKVDLLAMTKPAAVAVSGETDFGIERSVTDAAREPVAVAESAAAEAVTDSLTAERADGAAQTVGVAAADREAVLDAQVKRIKKRNRILEIVAWVMAGVVLVGALVYYNFFDKTEAYKVYGVGEACPEFTMQKFFGESSEGDAPATYGLADDLAAGKVVVLNFWYIGCGPCQMEIPDFGELAETYPDDVSVVIVHRNQGADELAVKPGKDGDRYFLESYVKNNMKWTLQDLPNVTFALDNFDTESIYLALKGKEAFPMTAILDRDGVIRFHKQGAVSRNELFDAAASVIEAE